MKLGQDTKLSIMMVVAAALLLQMSETLEYFSTRRTFNAQLTEMAQYDLNDSHRISQVKQEVEAATQAVLPKIAKQINEMDLDTLQILVKNLIKEQPQIVGVSIGYLPEFVTKEMDFGNHRYGIYIYENKNVKDSVETVKLKSKDYTERPWFEDILNSNGYWSEPYEGLYNYILMCSYSIPIRNDAGKTVAIMAADIPLREVSAAATKFYEMQRKSALRNFLFNLSGILLLGFIVYRAFSYLRRLNTAYAEKERFTGELNVARDIQESMIPKKFPGPSDRKDLEMFASLTPAREVGGDFYNFVLVDDDHLALWIGDVSDKGVPAALFMMAINIMINIRTSMGGTPAEIMAFVNDNICAHNGENMFVTIWLGILEISTGRLTFVNAGHEDMAVCRKGGQFELYKTKHNIAVGIQAGMVYKNFEMQLGEGDKIFIYTDGVPEATDPYDTLFSTRRMTEALNERKDRSPQEFLEIVHVRIKEFVGDRTQFDDLTMVGLELK